VREAGVLVTTNVNTIAPDDPAHAEYSRPCSACRAQVGQPCRGLVSGEPLHDSHHVRRDVANTEEDEDTMPKESKKSRHPFERLDGEVLDEHLIAKHGWDEQMVGQRGSQTNASKKFDYAQSWHATAHETATRD
jgi:hypothetical protein